MYLEYLEKIMQSLLVAVIFSPLISLLLAPSSIPAAAICQCDIPTH